MRNYYLFLFLLIGISNQSLAQYTPQLSEVVAVPLKIRQENRRIQITWSQKEVSSSLQDFKVLAIADMNILDTDLKINFALNQISPNLNYEMSINLLSEDGTLINATPENLGNLATTEVEEKKLLSLVWKNLIEEVGNFEKNYTLLIHTFVSGINCENPPVFGLQQKLPYYSAAVVGLGSIGLGQIFKQQSKQKEKDYLTIWKEGGVADLTEAKKDLDKYRIMTYAGLGVLLVDGALFFLRNKKHQKELSRFETFCAERVSISVIPGLNEPVDVGFKLKLKF